MKEIADALGWSPNTNKKLCHIAYSTSDDFTVNNYVVDKMDALALEEIPTKLEHVYWERDCEGELDWTTVWFAYTRTILPYLSKRLELGI